MLKHRAWLLALVLTAIVALVAAPTASQAQPKVTTAADGVVVAEGLNAPQGVLIDPDGNVWVIDSGVGGEVEVMAPSTETGEPISAFVGDSARIVVIGADGTQTDAAMLPSMLIGQEGVGGARLALADGALYATNGFWSSVSGDEPMTGMGAVMQIGEGGEVTQVASTWPIERDENPDGTGVVETHPYGLAAGPDGMLYVADAGANTVLKVDPASGDVSLLAVLDPVKGVFPNPFRGDELLADPVPTGIVVDDEGNVFVSLLTGAPFLPGNAKVVKITPDGEVSDYATGLTMLTDLRKGPDGEMYAVQFVLLTDQGPKPDSGGVFKIVEGASKSELVIQGLTFPTSVDFNAAGDAFVTTNGGFAPPGTGGVLQFASLVTPMAPMEAEVEAAAEPAMEEMASDSVTVADQDSNGEQVVVESVTAAENGWMVIHADDGGKPGPVLGKAAVPAGTTDNVIIMLDAALEGDASLWAMLHVDAGVMGEYEFPGPDGPVKIDDAVVMSPFVAKGAMMAEGDDAEMAEGDDAEMAEGDDAEMAEGDDAEMAEGDDAEMAEGDDAEMAEGDDAEMAEGDDAEMAEGDDAEMAEGDDAEMAESDDAEMAESEKMADEAPEHMPETGAEMSSATTSISVVVLVLLGLVATTLYSRRRHA